MLFQAYESACDSLTQKILDLIPAHPEIMTLGSIWDLFDVDGFDCREEGPSLAQAQHALEKARAIWRRKNGG